ncbi:Uncharacterized protein TCM_031341 [Theobroma cacao]|uniref:Uncharacterized protein n=1 Tax=Theobroma cacao TaxID=3641 RepID=A0A061F7G9_THECC|nr:Uncharacterized protein TCM_031341 [Theobroma cacao]
MKALFLIVCILLASTPFIATSTMARKLQGGQPIDTMHKPPRHLPDQFKPPGGGGPINPPPTP